MPVREVTPRELARALEAPEAERPIVLDVRNPDEVRVAPFPGALHVPLHEILILGAFICRFVDHGFTEGVQLRAECSPASEKEGMLQAAAHLR